MERQNAYNNYNQSQQAPYGVPPAEQGMVMYGQQAQAPLQQGQDTSQAASSGQTQTTTTQTTRRVRYSNAGYQQRFPPQQRAGYYQRSSRQRERDASHEEDPAPYYPPGHNCEESPEHASSRQPLTADHQTAQQANTSSSHVHTTVHEFSNAGGAAFRAAQAQGQRAVQQYEERVQIMIQSMGICPLGFQWYKAEAGYICGGGNHAIHYDDVDAWMTNSMHQPRVLLVNTPYDPALPRNPYTGAPMVMIGMHPPHIDLWQPMHQLHESFIEFCVSNWYLPPTKDGKCICMERMGVSSCEEETQKVRQAMRSGGRRYGYRFGFGF